MKENSTKKHSIKVVLRRLLYGVIITLPVIAYVFKFSILNRHGIFQGEDWDYFAQAYEAARVTIVHYHQFPWWNPWNNGGQPLFANPQFGLFSIQMPLVLLFGTVTGLHYSILIYFILGFWGMYLLLRRMGARSKLLAILLAYIWIFSGFNVGHLGGGQLTFALYLLSPWAFLTILNIHRRLGWLWFGLVSSLMILTAMHYITFEALLICIIIAAIQVTREVLKKHPKTLRDIVPILRPYVYALVLILVLCGVRMFYTFQFTHEFTRLEPLDPAESVKLFLASLLFRSGVNPASLTYSATGTYGWIEYADYFGLTTAVLFCYLLIKRFERLRSVTFKEWAILLAIVLAALITLGNFSSLSPYSILHHLPIFNQMRVPYRFVGWIVLGIILFLVRLPRKPIVYALLVVAVIDVFAANYSLIGYNEKPYIQTTSTASTSPFEQYGFFETSPSLGIGIMSIDNLRLLRATQENVGDIYGYEPILNIGEYYYLPGTDLCGVDIDQGCKFVLTNNAVVTYWSPEHITLKRTSSGPIKLDMNPGKVWQVNGVSIFSSYKILELQSSFVINSPAQTLNITFHPAIR